MMLTLQVEGIKQLVTVLHEHSPLIVRVLVTVNFGELLP